VRRTALPGHALRSEGKPYRLAGKDDGGLDVRATGSGGYGLCECGTSSGWLTSDGARKRWHKEHKEAIRNGN
jgi:hypothetical protein